MLDRSDSLLLVIDIQERLAPAITDCDLIIANTLKLLTSASQLKIPHLVTEQYPKGIGATVACLKSAINPQAIIEKIYFSAVKEPVFNQHLKQHCRQQIVIAGTEAHVCVLQTALLLLEEGYQVFVVEDAAGSRKDSSKKAALRRLQGAGAQCVTTEMVIFEWLARADSEDFRTLLPIIK